MNEREAWVAYLENDVLSSETPGGLRVYELVIKVKEESLLGIVKVSKGSNYMVGFVGGRTLPSLARRVRDYIQNEESGWRKDQFA